MIRQLISAFAYLLLLAVVMLASCVEDTRVGERPDAQSPRQAVTIYLVRHGQTDWNLQGRLQGNTDNPLNATGREQAEDLARRLAEIPVDHIYCSTLKRATATAEAFADRASITALAALNERSRGAFEGRIAREVADEFEPRFHSLEDELDGGESLQATYDRVKATTLEIINKHPHGNVIIVGHSGINPLVIASLIDLPPEQAIARIRQGNDEVIKLTVYPSGHVNMWKMITRQTIDEF